MAGAVGHQLRSLLVVVHMVFQDVDDGSGVNFFFQAEDGIRDLIVTGVQTCALPILWSSFTRMLLHTNFVWSILENLWSSFFYRKPSRSEERRVGKECRSRWSPY